MIINIYPTRILIQNNVDNTHYSAECISNMIYGIMKINNIKGKIQVDNEKDEVIVFAPMENMYRILYEISWLFAHSIESIR